MKPRDSRGVRSGRLILVARGCSKASYSRSILHSSSPWAAALPPRSSQRSSCWPMCARSHTRGLISGLCWVVSSVSSKSVSRRVRAREASSPRAAVSSDGSGTCFLLEYGEWSARLDGAAQLGAGAAPGRDQLGEALDVALQRRRTVLRGELCAAGHRASDRLVVTPVPG